MDPLTCELLNGIKASYNNELVDPNIEHLSNRSILDLFKDWLYQELEDEYTEDDENEDKDNIEKDPEFKASYDDIGEALAEKRHERIECKILERKKDREWLLQYLKRNLKERFNIFFMNDCSRHKEDFLVNGILCGGNWSYLSENDLRLWYVKFLFKAVNQVKSVNIVDTLLTNEFLTEEEIKYTKGSYKVREDIGIKLWNDYDSGVRDDIKNARVTCIERVRDPIQGISRESMISFILQRQEKILKNTITYLDKNIHDSQPKLTHNDRESIESIIENGLPHFKAMLERSNGKKKEKTKIEKVK